MSDTPTQSPARPAAPAAAGAQKKSQFQARLENQKSQLERHGNFAEVVIRTTPEGTDMINFARLWEYILVQADRQTRGYVAKSSRADFEETRKGFEDSIDFMVQKLKDAVARHKIDLGGTNFISRVAQRYNIVEKVRKAPSQPQPAPAKAVVAPAPQPEGDASAAAKPARPQRVKTTTTPPDDVDVL